MNLGLVLAIHNFFFIFGLEVNNQNWCFTFNTLVFKNLC